MLDFIEAEIERGEVCQLAEASNVGYQVVIKVKIL